MLPRARSYFGHLFRLMWEFMSRLLFAAFLAALLGLGGAGAWAQYAAQSPYGKAERRDPIFLRFPEMAHRFWEDPDTLTASHRAVAVPMPRQCAFVYADAYTKGQMSESEVQDTALSICKQKLTQLGPLGDNYGIDCQCKIVVSDGKYVVPRETMPEQAYGPVSIFYRDDKGNVARLNGVAHYGALIGRDRSVTFLVENPRAEPVCEGTFTSDGANAGRFSLSCFNGKFSGNGTYQSKVGAPNDHIIGHGQTGRSLPIVLVIGLPSQLAAGTYGGI
jgi:hypothetical protein